jgi:hypothetical protein
MSSEATPVGERPTREVRFVQFPWEYAQVSFRYAKFCP